MYDVESMPVFQTEKTYFCPPSAYLLVWQWYCLDQMQKQPRSCLMFFIMGRESDFHHSFHVQRWQNQLRCFRTAKRLPTCQIKSRELFSTHPRKEFLSPPSTGHQARNNGPGNNDIKDQTWLEFKSTRPYFATRCVPFLFVSISDCMIWSTKHFMTAFKSSKNHPISISST